MTKHHRFIKLLTFFAISVFFRHKKRLRKIEHLHQKGTFSWDPYFSLHLKYFILNTTSVYKTSQLPNNPHMPQKLPEIPSNNISIQSGVELYKEIRASFLEAKRFLLLFCSRYNAFSVYKVLLTKSFGGFFFFNRRYSLLSFGGPQLYTVV